MDNKKKVVENPAKIIGESWKKWIVLQNSVRRIHLKSSTNPGKLSILQKQVGAIVDIIIIR